MGLVTRYKIRYTENMGYKRVDPKEFKSKAEAKRYIKKITAKGKTRKIKIGGKTQTIRLTSFRNASPYGIKNPRIIKRKVYR